MAIYICIEGTEGVGKTTQTQKLVDFLRDKGFKVLQTKEPGTALSPVTMKLREIMLSNKFDENITPEARELISQAIRSIHVKKVIEPALKEYDYIVQDRGVISGLCYGSACGNELSWLEDLCEYAIDGFNDLYTMYDHVLYLKGDPTKGLKRAVDCKNEFEEGDAMEDQGDDFIKEVSNNMDEITQWFNAVTINVDNKDIDSVFSEVLSVLDIKE